ncbi:uncharacterized protein AMSG_07522 [Thecamonas trahens ATCC 50062]|uniref:Uncharacterized protein n=1 Tax=Thecamonas trahens ATCC 50062 TaxID=461836 RepID=A0A0L0DHN4_THETB|nr:hypothetical protein AMSG_07522 [Thecamonas trahens ATCC 50062]KNC51611.1 hypothetical protein AMSG_07522 [Thecamonas trahens ATCC 50062]|eukprot:XP_013756007.1 hypothetical protein AMSG_07522 [Thecamonas trahens ATCC 50062]
MIANRVQSVPTCGVTAYLSLMSALRADRDLATARQDEADLSVAGHGLSWLCAEGLSAVCEAASNGRQPGLELALVDATAGALVAGLSTQGLAVAAARTLAPGGAGWLDAVVTQVADGWADAGVLAAASALWVLGRGLRLWAPVARGLELAAGGGIGFGALAAAWAHGELDAGLDAVLDSVLGEEAELGKCGDGCAWLHEVLLELLVPLAVVDCTPGNRARASKCLARMLEASRRLVPAGCSGAGQELVGAVCATVSAGDWGRGVERAATAWMEAWIEAALSREDAGRAGPRYVGFVDALADEVFDAQSLVSGLVAQRRGAPAVAATMLTRLVASRAVVSQVPQLLHACMSVVSSRVSRGLRLDDDAVQAVLGLVEEMAAQLGEVVSTAVCERSGRVVAALVDGLSALAHESRDGLLAALGLWQSIAKCAGEALIEVGAELVLSWAHLIEALVRLKIDVQVVAELVALAAAAALSSASSSLAVGRLLNDLVLPALVVRPVIELVLESLAPSTVAEFVHGLATIVVQASASGDGARGCVLVLAANSSVETGGAVVTKLRDVVGALPVGAAHLLEPLECSGCLAGVSCAGTRLGPRLQAVLGLLLRAPGWALPCATHPTVELSSECVVWLARMIQVLRDELCACLGSAAALARLVGTLRHPPWVIAASSKAGGLVARLALVLAADPCAADEFVPSPPELRVLMRAGEVESVARVVNVLSQCEAGRPALVWLLACDAVFRLAVDVAARVARRTRQEMAATAMWLLKTKGNPAGVLVAVEVAEASVSGTVDMIREVFEAAPARSAASLVVPLVWHAGLFDAYDGASSTGLSVSRAMLDACFRAAVCGEELFTEQGVWESVLAVARAASQACSLQRSSCIGGALEVLARAKTLFKLEAHLSGRSEGRACRVLDEMFCSCDVRAQVASVGASIASHAGVMAQYVASLFPERDTLGEFELCVQLSHAARESGLWMAERSVDVRLLAVAEGLADDGEAAYVAVAATSLIVPRLEAVADAVGLGVKVAVLEAVVRFEAAATNMRLFGVPAMLARVAARGRLPVGVQRRVAALSAAVTASASGMRMVPATSGSEGFGDAICTPLAVVVASPWRYEASEAGEALSEEAASPRLLQQ